MGKLEAFNPAPRQERQEAEADVGRNLEMPWDTPDRHTPYRSERKGLKKPRRLFSKRELFIQAGSIFAGKFF